MRRVRPSQDRLNEYPLSRSRPRQRRRTRLKALHSMRPPQRLRGVLPRAAVPELLNLLKPFHTPSPLQPRKMRRPTAQLHASNRLVRRATLVVSKAARLARRKSSPRPMAWSRILPRVRSASGRQLRLSRRIPNGRRRERPLARTSERLTGARAPSSGKGPIGRPPPDAMPRPAPVGAAWRTEE
jgi:hypothetical protein